ncbi:MAG: hypothetical protein IJ746_02290 [Ruminococcus sp.]|nr:hypothetical protein [Ruminococcus sp.]
MLFKRIFGAACAAVISLSCMAVTALADAAEDDSSQIEFTVTDSFLTDDMQPALSFDNEDWKNYIFSTKDADLVGISTASDKSTYYQGFSLKVTATGSYSGTMFMNAGTVRDADNNLVYPDATNEDAEFVCPGIELRAESFGLSCFDGCSINFKYKIGSDAENKLMGNSIYVFGTNEEYEAPLSEVLRLEYDVVYNDNVTQYRDGFLAVSPTANATRIVFEVPALQKLDSDAVCLDNIYIIMPDGTSAGYVKNLDGFNANAEAQETIEGIQIKQKADTADVSTSEAKDTSSSKKPVIIIIVVIAVIIVGLVVFFVIKHKTKYY